MSGKYPQRSVFQFHIVFLGRLANNFNALRRGIRERFFQNLEIECFEPSLLDYKSLKCNSDLTVGEMYEVTGLTTLRFYLTTTCKEDDVCNDDANYYIPQTTTKDDDAVPNYDIPHFRRLPLIEWVHNSLEGNVVDVCTINKYRSLYLQSCMPDEFTMLVDDILHNSEPDPKNVPPVDSVGNVLINLNKLISASEINKVLP
ncbi:hypothetical protein RI129_001443 [Pyrocoelia pectoralis]|uniref:Uncharacterized protein n=1 Tax=Pyrocoelia pectoralis TaxID=417401 RepID=A0AAN7VVK0_9COLE